MTKATKAETPQPEAPAIDNLSLWSTVETTDPAFTKSYKGNGGFQGTATSATYLVKKATDQFGLIGIGWGYEILEEEILEGATTLDKSGEKGTEKIHKIRLKLWYKWNGEQGEVVHFGQTTFVGKNKYGWFTDEEAPKKSLTDALTKCLSMLGFAADIHLGMYDDNRYVNDLKKEFRDNDEFDARRRGNRSDERSPETDADRKVEGKATDKAPPKGNAKSTDAPKADNSNDPDDGEMTDDELVDEMKDEIDKAKTGKEISEFMSKPSTIADLKSLPRDLEDDVKAYGRQVLKDKFNFPAGNKEKASG